MNAAQIQAKVNRGYAIAASKLGFPFTHYRPTDPLNPLATPFQVLPADFAINAAHSRAATFKDLAWSVNVDGSQTRAGDYLVEVSPTQTGMSPRTFYILSQQPLMPISAVMCDHTASILRPTSGTGVGALPYNGDIAPAETPIMTGFPCSISQGTKGEKSDTSLPGDTRMPWYSVLLPAMSGVAIETDDILVDESGHRYKVSSTELSDLGWRLSVMLAET